MTRFLHFAVFIAGLAVACWVGAGYVNANPLALGVTALIVAAYLVGALELHRYQQASSTLARALAALSEPPDNLEEWLSRLDPGLRNAVRLRIEGDRVGLPGPALAPYLAGLLVLLGMLGTFLGMVATLRGAGLALESASDLQAIRASLAAPVKGLGFAFGTSVAGVATSAMLGLLSALCRRERIRLARLLDARIATVLRSHTLAHQRAEQLRLLQRQADALPAVADRLQSMMTAMEAHSQALGKQLTGSQEAFHGKAEAAYTRLAASVEHSLREGIADGARAAGTAIQPIVEGTMARLAQEAASLHDTVTQSMQRQLDGLSSHATHTAESLTDAWTTALAGQRQMHASLVQDLRATLDKFAAAYEQRSATLLDGVSARLEGVSSTLSDSWSGALARQEDSGRKLAADNQQALTAAAAALEQQAAALVDAVGRSHTELRAQLAGRDEQQLAAWSRALGEITAALRKEWEQAADHAAMRQREICDALARSARDISSEAQAQARSTVAEIAQLMQSAAEAPKAAADAIAEARRQLSESLLRDKALLEERRRLAEALETLMDSAKRASAEQRLAIDALVAGSADTLERVGRQVADKVEGEAGKLGGIAAQVTGSALEVASLGEAFGAAVQLFTQSNASLVEHLQRIEAALDKSIARSDEQLAYYVAQAREVIDLSMMSQKQIMEELQQLAAQGASAGSEAA